MSFPRQYARTRRFTLGVPRGFQISPDGSRVAFLRTKGGADPVTCLWTLDITSGHERLAVDPGGLDTTDEELPPEELARRERAREAAGGIVAFTTDRDLKVTAFALSGQLHTTRLDADDAAARLLPAATPVFDPRPDPSGRRIAYVSGRSLRVIDVEDGQDRALAEPESDQVSYGLAEFVAAEEMGRMRGYWWAPDGETLLVARADESPVHRWHISDPANPGKAPVEMAYPAAGTPNADVSLWIIKLDGTSTRVDWDTTALPYLVTVRWDRHGALAVVQSRDQKMMRILAVDPATGATEVIREDTDPVWLDIVAGVPARTTNGDLVWTADVDDSRRLLVGDEIVTPPELRVRSIADVDGDTVLFTASAAEPAEVHLWTYGPDGLNRLTEGQGVYGGRRVGGTTVIAGSQLDRHGVETTVNGIKIASYAETPLAEPRVELIRAGELKIPTAVLLPTGYDPASGPLPVLMDPYGGPHGQRVLASRRIFCGAQWWADQGFAVIVADGRGTPVLGRTWERSVRGDYATPVLEDQVTALQAVAERYPLDLSKVAIRGWSFGGFVAALAVLRRPDVFHAAVAGAPVTDQRLYDTHYTERYLGHPDEEPESYERCSLIADAPKLSRPLLLIHGLADDNVVAAHTLRLSSALLAAGRPHNVLPLCGVTHMTPQEVVAENLLLVQVEFLKRSLGLPI